MQEHGLDAVVVVPGANLAYLAGLDFSTRLRLTAALFPAQGQQALVLPEMELERARAHAPGELHIYPWGDAEGPNDALRRAAVDTGLGGRIGVEHYAMRVFELRALEAAVPGAQFVDATPLLSRMRMVKDAGELAAIREAVRLIEQALRETIGQIRAGMTELEVAEIWLAAIRATGCPPSFEIAVGSGPNGASPHHTNGQRRLQAGDLVVMDGGVVYNGYASDITRTIAIGEPAPEVRRIYELVKEANAAGRAACAPGVTGEAVDRAARSIIEAGGYGPQFIHRTGHGFGLEIHEPPFIVGGNQAPLIPGNTFTIEPGIYVPGLCGVRIEDDMVITGGGAECLTSFERDLIIVTK